MLYTLITLIGILSAQPIPFTKYQEEPATYFNFRYEVQINFSKKDLVQMDYHSEENGFSASYEINSSIVTLTATLQNTDLDVLPTQSLYPLLRSNLGRNNLCSVTDSDGRIAIAHCEGDSYSIYQNTLLNETIITTSIEGPTDQKNIMLEKSKQIEFSIFQTTGNR